MFFGHARYKYVSALGLAPAVDNLGSHAVSLQTRCRTAAWRLRAHSVNLIFSLHALATGKSLLLRDRKRCIAEAKPAICFRHCEDGLSNSQ